MAGEAAAGWAVKRGLVLLVLATAAFAVTPRDGFTCRRADSNPCDIPFERADRIYAYVTAQIAREISADHPPKLQPRLELVLGKPRGITVDIDHTVLYLPKWDEKDFAIGVAVSAATHVLSMERLAAAVNTAFVFLNATTSVKELQEGKK